MAPHKRLGQNFLIDANIARKSLELASIQTGDRIVEIGPGLGALTRLLLEAGCDVHAIEKDKGLYGFLKETIGKDHLQRLHLRLGDALEFPLASLEHPDPGAKIVANLPYAISTPWLDAVLSQSLVSRMVLMLQAETARRFTAEPGSGNYGPISIFLNAAYDLEAQHRVSPHCFYPPPEVGSTLLSLKRKGNPVSFPADCKAGIRRIFRQRRKQISSLVSKAGLPGYFKSWLEQLIREGLAPTARPESIPPEQWQRLINP